MKPKYEYYPVLIILLLISFQGIYADQSQKILHPKFRLLDPAGMPINGDITKLSIKTSCGECHRVDYINQSNPHHGRNLKISCIACHLPPNMNESNDPNIYKAIQSPTDSNCASCHGIIHDGSKGLKIPEDFAQFDTDGPLKMKYRLTRREGAIFSGSQISDSLLNLRDKNRQNIAWDIHANRQLHCTACHFTRNNPAKYRPIRSDILHLTHDPRKLLSTDDYIRKPDHNFYAAKCRDCHDPFQIHDDLPYKKRHFQKLSCTACHIKNIKGPILRVIDQTLLNQRGDARIEIRGLDQSKSHGSTINTAYLQATSPALYPRDSAIASQTIVPVNLISHWYWVSKQNGKAVDLELLKGAIIENGQYSSAFISIFDANGNRIIERDEFWRIIPKLQ